MLVLNHDVPQALILPEEVTDLRTHLQAQGALWFRAQADCVDRDAAGAVQALHSLTGAATAIRTEPNKDNSRLEPIGLAFREGVHCGYQLPQVTPGAGEWSCALRFSAPSANARTLFTLNSDTVDNYIFLAQIDGQLVLKDQQNTREVTLPTPGLRAGPLTVLAGQSDGRLWLGLPESAAAQTPPGEIEMGGPCTLYIGCRSNRARLLKTLGGFLLHDLLFWPDRNILDPAQEMTRRALADPAIWTPAP